MLDLRWRLVGSETYKVRPLSGVNYLVVHHSAVDVDSSALSIAQYHVNTLGWPGAGYHFRIGWDGAIDYMGDISLSRYNVARRNDEVIGICLPGDWTAKEPPIATLLATRRLLAWLKTVVPQAQIVGHKDIALPGYETACPGDLWPGWRSKII